MTPKLSKSTRIKLIAVAVCFFIVAGLVVFRVTATQPREEYLVVEDAFYEPLLFASCEDSLWLAYPTDTGGSLLMIDEETGSSQLWQSFTQELFWAAPRGENLFFLWMDGDGLAQLSRVSASDKTRTDFSYPVNLGDLIFYDTSPDADLYYVSYEDYSTLNLCSSTGEAASHTFAGEISFLAVSPQGKLYVFAGDTLFLSADGSLESLAPVGSASMPAALLGEDVIFDADQHLLRVSQESIETLFTCPSYFISPLFCCEDGVEFLFAEDTALTWYSDAGEVTHEDDLSHLAVAVSPAGTIYQKDDNCWYYSPHTYDPLPPYEPPESSSQVSSLPSESESSISSTPESSSKVDSTPSSEPSAPSESEPSTPSESEPSVPSQPESSLPSQPETSSEVESSEPSPTPTPFAEGRYFILSPGCTAQELRNLMLPEAVLIRTADGVAVTQGRLATGMTANDYTIVIVGDCTGTGTVSSQDVLAAQQALLGDTPLQGPAYSRAADMDGDGALTAVDLVLMAIHLLQFA